jgi:predicted nuclease of predicted toxin-antitoxin system
MIRLLLDQNLPPSLVTWFNERGFDAVHVREIGLRDSTDHQIWQRSLAEGRIIVTKDSDFAAMSRSNPNKLVRVVWCRIGNMRNRLLLAWLGQKWPAAEALLKQGHIVIELR